MSEQNDDSKQSGVSRRGFLRNLGMGTVATSSGLVGSYVEEAEAAEQQTVLGPGAVPVALQINGQTHRLDVEPRVTLLDALRNRLDLTGSKKVCDEGTCGACTVLMDGEPVYACTVFAIEAEGREITTIEGLGSPERMTPVQSAFVENDAQQCGFCTPGFVVACTAFLEKNPNPSLEEVREGLGGNLCRCGTYQGIMNAVLEAAKSSKKGGA